MFERRIQLLSVPWLPFTRSYLELSRQMPFVQAPRTITHSVPCSMQPTTHLRSTTATPMEDGPKSIGAALNILIDVWEVTMIVKYHSMSRCDRQSSVLVSSGSQWPLICVGFVASVDLQLLDSARPGCDPQSCMYQCATLRFTTKLGLD